MSQSPKSKVQSPKSDVAEAALAPELEGLRLELERQRAELQELRRSMGEAVRNGYRFNGDDSAFMIWVLGFTAGAHMSRNGEQGEVIFARCRDIYMRAFPGGGPLAPGGGNPS